MNDRTESILTDLIEQSRDLSVLRSRVGPLTPTVGQILLTSQPLRQCFLVVPDTANASVFIAPNEQATAGVVSKASDGTPLLIHSAAYPLLVGMTWWIVSPAADTVTVYQVLRRT